MKAGFSRVASQYLKRYERLRGLGLKKLVVLFGVVVLVGCGQHEKPNFTYMPDMAYSPAVKPQEPGSMMTPPAGSVSQGHSRYPYEVFEQEKAGSELENPLAQTKAVLEKGREYFNIYCIVCHGPYGEGDGSVVPAYPQPPSLQTDKIRDYPDGRIFHIITKGQGLMPSYSTQVNSEERWAIIHYLRVLQRAKNPSQDDLKKLEAW